MTDLWSTLVPLAVASAVVPVQLIVTIVLVESSLRTAAAWVAGMATLRLLQGLLFGVVLTAAGPTDSGASSGPGPLASTLLLVLAVLFYVTALRKALAGDDPDAPPPAWMEKARSLTPWRAYLAGMAFLAIAVKFWVFTLGAIGAITDAELGRAAGIGTFVAFVVLAQSGHLAILTLAAAGSQRSAAVLGGFSEWLRRNSRVVAIVLGVVFGTWFLGKALSGFGIL